jgi:hypothetical protein
LTILLATLLEFVKLFSQYCAQFPCHFIIHFRCCEPIWFISVQDHEQCRYARKEIQGLCRFQVSLETCLDWLVHKGVAKYYSWTQISMHNRFANREEPHGSRNKGGELPPEIFVWALICLSQSCA